MHSDFLGAYNISKDASVGNASDTVSPSTNQCICHNDSWSAKIYNQIKEGIAELESIKLER